jgi:diguanylate cyclase (GGDEF)-like protein
MPSDAAGTLRDSEQPVAGRTAGLSARAHPAIRLHYRARAAAYLNMAALPLLAIAERGFRVEWLLVALWCLAFPHLARWLAPRYGNSRATEHRVMQLDSANAALVSGACGFALFPSAVMILAMLMNALINGGARFGLAQLPFVAAGALAGAALGGFAFDWRSSLGASVIATIGLVSYVVLVGLNAHAMQLRLRRTKSELVDKSRQLEEASLTDPLTQVRNRRYITARLGETERALRAPLAFALIDVDHFKRITDQHGHAAGDAVLRELALRLSRAWPAPHDVVRWGGEEFLVVAHGIEPARLPRLAEEIRAQVAIQRFAIPGAEPIRVGVSIGLAPYPFGPRLDRLDWTRVIDLADRGLYEAKRSGRNTWVAITPGPVAEEVVLADRSLAEAERLGVVTVTRPSTIATRP